MKSGSVSKPPNNNNSVNGKRKRGPAVKEQYNGASDGGSGGRNEDWAKGSGNTGSDRPGGGGGADNDNNSDGESKAPKKQHALLNPFALGSVFNHKLCESPSDIERTEGLAHLLEKEDLSEFVHIKPEQMAACARRGREDLD